MSLWYLSLVKTLIHEVRVTCPGWFNMEFLNEASFLHRNRMTILKLCLIHFHSRSCQRNMPPISPIYNWENEVKQVKNTEENLSQSCILSQLVREQRPSNQVKITWNIILFLLLFALYLLSGCDLFNLFCLS